MTHDAFEFEKIVDRVLEKMAKDQYIPKDIADKLRAINASPEAKYHTTSALGGPRQPSAIVGDFDNFAINVRGTWINVTC